MPVELLGGAPINGAQNPPTNPQAQEDPAGALKAQLERITAENQQLRSQWTEKQRQYDQTVGRLGNQLEQLNKRLTESQPAPPAPKSKKIPAPISENFETELQEVLDQREGRILSMLEEHGKRLDQFGQAMGKVGFAMAVRSEQEDLKQKYGFSDQDVQEAMEEGSRRNYDSVFAAAAVVPHLREKLFSRPAPPPPPVNNGTTVVTGNVNALANEFSRQATQAVIPTSSNNRPVQQGYQEKYAEFQSLNSSGRLWELPEAERRQWMNWATGVAAGQIPMQ